ncbi:MAG: divergent PAP2 family protein [Nanoarchaeota archaeon]|nr:divergent PAP2 family protein [Nanoarchaeota archaeon]MBU0977417.1 divergent PAP2 family protein [Nanoarchaeota archaeon]
MIEWDILVSAVLTLLAVQAIKFSWALYHGKVVWGDVLADGGVISAHTGAVSALCFSVYFVEGFSNLFFVSLVFSLIVLRDAIGVRRVARENARILDKEFKLKRHVSEGHSLREVLFGALLGGIVSVVVFVV